MGPDLLVLRQICHPVPNYLSEFIDTYGENPTDEEFVTLLYQNVLQRDPDAAGLAYWVGVLQSTNNRERMVVDFTESVEFRNIVNPEIQATLHTAAKVAVGQMSITILMAVRALAVSSTMRRTVLRAVA